MPDHKSNDTKRLAVEFYLSSDESLEYSSEIFQTSRSSLERWIKIYNENEGKVERHNRLPISYKLTKEHVSYIKEQIKENS